MQITINRKTILWGIISVGIITFQIYVAYLWLHTPPAKAAQLKPLLKEIQDFKTVHGRYPSSCEQFSEFTNLTNNFSVYTGEHTTNGVDWLPTEVSNHDFTILVEREGYEIFLPTGRMKMISFSSFPVWRLDSTEHHWRKGRIHWFIGGSYWSE